MRKDALKLATTSGTSREQNHCPVNGKLNNHRPPQALKARHKKARAETRVIPLDKARKPFHFVPVWTHQLSQQFGQRERRLRLTFL
jgi:hypothetical protein